VKERATYYRSLYGLEREEKNFMEKYKGTFDELATIVNIPAVFEF
jgi:hypothetical protein